MKLDAASVRRPGEPVWRAIARSWLAMKTWVKVWLFFLNGVFLAALAFDDPLADWTLVAYVGSGVLLAPLMVAHGGLTRLLGVAHLLPWLPLLAYAELRLTSTLAGPRIEATAEPVLFGWAVLLWASVLACLALDAWDVVRWWRGERFVLGSEEAVAAGASQRAPRWS